jgi:hypothetical protein
MKLKKILLILTLAIALYLGIGAFLVYKEKIQRLYIFPGWSITHGATDEDDSTVSSDGPLIIYENSKILSYQIFPKDSLYAASKVEISKQDTLTCYVDETKDTFKFQLKDSLEIEPTEYALPNKMLIISDIEGNFNGFKSILLGNKIINNQLNWTFGNNHLVLVGDFFDRGLNITECLWLIYKLEKEAEKQGGKVHFILGNHEMMNLKGELKYVRDKYYENADTLKLDYEKWYTNNTELGRWLRTKNGVVKIGDYLFVHAGIRKDFPNQYTLQSINDNIRKSIDKNYAKEEDQRDDIFIGIESPIWYRGVAKKDEDQKDIERTLDNYKASKMIIGHTIFEEIQFLYNQKVIAIDLEHKANSDKGKMFALWFENNEFKVIDQNGTKTALK